MFIQIKQFFETVIRYLLVSFSSSSIPAGHEPHGSSEVFIASLTEETNFKLFGQCEKKTNGEGKKNETLKRILSRLF